MESTKKWIQMMCPYTCRKRRILWNKNSCRYGRAKKAFLEEVYPQKWFKELDDFYPKEISTKEVNRLLKEYTPGINRLLNYTNQKNENLYNFQVII